MLKKILAIIVLLSFTGCFEEDNKNVTEPVIKKEKRNFIRLAGSSTVYPFITIVAEEFGRGTSFKTPVIESTGTGGGFKLFCSGIGKQYIDIVNASRSIKNSEIERCQKNGITVITEIKIGYDGIVLANKNNSYHFNLTKQQIFNALAKYVVIDGKLMLNPYEKWSDIDKLLPDFKIEIYGPPPTSGTRDAFVELVMEEPCINNQIFKENHTNLKLRKKACHILREDGVFKEVGENDNLIVQKLNNNPSALGIFGYSFLDQNGSKIQPVLINSVEPTFENIAGNFYSVSRPLFIYMKDQHIPIVDGLKKFAQEVVSSRATGQDGYLTYNGLIPLEEEELLAIRSLLNSK